MKAKNILLLALLLSIISSCKKEEVMTYEGQNMIYFNHGNPDSYSELDSLNVFFAYADKPVVDSLISIKVRILGNKENYDREFKLIVVDTATTAMGGVDFEILPSVIYANETTGDAHVKLINSERLKKETLTLKIKLMPNDHFKTGLEGMPYYGPTALEYKLRFDDVLSAPLAWIIFPTYFESYYFGTYSNVKYRVICEVCDLNNEYFTFSDRATLSERFPAALIAMWQRMINRYLENYREEHGTELRDENGQQVKMPNNYI